MFKIRFNALCVVGQFFCMHPLMVFFLLVCLVFLKQITMQILIIFLHYLAILLNIWLILRILPSFLRQGLARPRIYWRSILPRIPKATILILLLPENILLLLQKSCIPTLPARIHLSQLPSIRSIHLLPILYPASIGGSRRIAGYILLFFGVRVSKEAHLLIEERILLVILIIDFRKIFDVVVVVSEKSVAFSKFWVFWERLRVFLRSHNGLTCSLIALEVQATVENLELSDKAILIEAILRGLRKHDSAQSASITNIISKCNHLLLLLL